MSKILITRFSSIGDIVITSAAVRCVRQAFPDSEIHFATKEVFSPLVQYSPHIDKLRLLGDEWNAYVSTFKGEHFDVFIDLHKNIRTRLLRSAVRADQYISYGKRNLDKWLLVNLKLNRLNRYSVNQNYFTQLEQLGVQYDGEGLDFYYDVSSISSGIKDLASEPYLVMALGAQFATKQAPVDILEKLVAELNGRVMLIGGERERAIGDLLATTGSNVVNLCGSTTLPESAYLIENAGKVFSHDTGMMHIAAAFDKDLAVLWGSSVPEFGFAPVYPESSRADVRHFENSDIGCRPCSKLGHQKCPKKHFKCMREIDYQEIASFLNQ